jgi:Sec-independent protein translocase protein TatA
MDFFGIGGSELLLLLFLGGVLLGPRRVAQLARDVRGFIGQIRALTTNLTEQLNREINLMEAAEPPVAKPNPSGAAVETPPAAANDALPEAYRRFREDFPKEGKLEGASGETGQRNGQADRAPKASAPKSVMPPEAGGAPVTPPPPPGRPAKP